MKLKSTLLSAFILTSCTASAPVVYAAEENKSPKPLKIELTIQEAQTVISGLNLAAANCANSQDSCLIGYNKKPIFDKIDAAYTKINPSPKSN